ncbi:hypothetical protein TPA0907_56080 [Micromonospora humidisoli]|uniref:hypothetical protein n=1 Tax=unclassified Micromonospora TaxID=2617518 RepID=UPI0022BC0488|nr:hypothetical protein [Micromonospora sp. AKA109]GHJ11241.1 hypothetical protein TPA0907_56080 [Micromonospora sp. AKA109]
MTITHRVCGRVPQDSPLRMLVGRTVALPAPTLAQLAARLTEATRVGIRPRIQVVR